MLRIIVFTVLCGLFAACRPAWADDEFAASLRLRGGYDTNPQFTNGGAVGSGFVSTETALAAGGKDGDITWSASADASATRYIHPGLEPALVGKIVLRGTMGDDDFRATATTSLADVNTYNTRSTDLSQALKLETLQDHVKLFVTGEVALSRLNQTNVIFQDFLPTPLEYWRGSIIPGVSVVQDKYEIGTSLNLSMRRYTDEYDLFGYHRDNERIQPFLFGRYEDGDVSAFASVSRLYGIFHDVDFSNVNTVLYDANVVWRPKPFTLEFTAARRAGDTTFPISPITIDSILSAKGTWQVNDKWLLSAAAGFAQSDYLDSPYQSKTYTLGVGAVRDLGSGLKLGFDLTRVTGTLLNGENAQGFIIASSLTKSFAPAAAKSGKDEAAKPAQ